MLLLKRAAAVAVSVALMGGAFANGAVAQGRNDAKSATIDAQSSYGALKMLPGFGEDSGFYSLQIDGRRTDGPRDAAVQADGKIIVVGLFTHFKGNALPMPNIARLNADGTIDPSFNRNQAGPNNVVDQIELLPDGTMFITGGFTTFNGRAMNTMARLDQNGGLVAGFEARMAPASSPKSITYDPSTQSMILVGSFLRYQNVGYTGGCSTTYTDSCVLRDYVAAVDLGGILRGTVFSGIKTKNGGSARASAAANGRIFIGGEFGATPPRNLEAFKPDGSIDTNFNKGGAGANGAVRAAIVVDKTLYVTGSFTTYNGVAARGVAKLNGDPASPDFGKPMAGFQVDFPDPGMSFNANNGGYSIQQDVANDRILVTGQAQTQVSGPASGFAYALRPADGSTDRSYNFGRGFNQKPRLVHDYFGVGALLVGEFTTYDGQLATSVVKLGQPARTATGLPRITGTGRLNEQLTAADPVLSGSGTATFSYRWFVDGSPVANATAKTFTPTDASFVGKSVVVEVTATTSAQLPTTTVRSEPLTVLAGALSTPEPTVSGAIQVGQKITATAGAATPAADSVTFAWLRNGEPISGATTSSYTPVPSDAGENLKIRVTYKRAGYSDKVVAKDLGTVAPGVLSAGKPTISGDPGKAGSKLTALPPAFAVTPSALTYQWFADGALIPRATEKDFTPSTAQAGKQISVQMTAAADGYSQWDATSLPVGPVGGYFSATAPTIAGTPKVGENLVVATSGVFTPTPDSVAVQWLADGSPIPGATANSLTLAPAQVDKQISARLTASKAGNDPLTIDTDGRGPVAKGTLAVTGSPTIPGTIQVDALVRANVSKIVSTPSGASLSYQWTSNGSPIVGATGDSLQLTAARLGERIGVTVTLTLAGYDAFSVSSNAEIVTRANLTLVSSPTVSANPRVGQISRVETLPQTTPASTPQYQWRVGGSNVSGATGLTYTPRPDDATKSLEVAVTYEHPGYNTFNRTYSSGTVAKAVLASANDRPTITGDLGPGKVLSVTLPNFAAAPANVQYQWLVGGTEVSGATGNKYTIRPADNGKTITVRVTATGPTGYDNWTGTSQAVGPVSGYFTVSNTDRKPLSDALKVGGTVRVNYAGFSPAPNETEVEWLADGESVSSQTFTSGTQTELALTEDLFNRRIAARITAKSSDPNVPNLSFVTGSTEPVGPGSITVTGSSPLACQPECRVGDYAYLMSEGDLSFTPDDAEVRFEWLADGTVVPGETDLVIQMSAGLVGKSLKLRLIFSKTGYTDATYETAAITVLPGVLAEDGDSSITGDVQVGGLVAVTAGQTSPTSRISYQWEVDGQAVSGATGSTFRPRAQDVGKPLQVVVTYRVDGFEPRVETKVAGTVAKGVLASGLPGVSGSPVQGQTLTAVPPQLATDASFSYQWLADDAEIDGATARTFALTAGQVGSRISVRVSATATGYEDWADTSTAVGPVTSAYTVSAPTISGSAAVDQELSISTAGVFTPAPDSVAIEWRANGRPIDGATGTKYTPTAAQVGQLVSVRLTAKKSGLEDVSVNTTGVRVAAGTLTPSGSPAITGTPKVGEVLEAQDYAVSPTADGYTYQWLLDGEEVAGATGRTLPLTRELIGRVSVRVTAERDGYDPVARSATAVTVVKGSLTVGQQPTATANPKVGQASRVENAGTTTPAAQPKFQWRVGGADVSGATSQTYTPAPADAGRVLVLRVTYELAGYVDEVVDVSLGQVAKAELAPAADRPTITGAPTPGQRLRVTLPNFAATPAAVGYQWLVDGQEVGTGDSYTIRPADNGKSITVTASATGPTGYENWSGTSQAVGPVNGYFTVSNTDRTPQSDDLKVGGTVSVDYSGFSPTPDVIEIQWLADGDVVSTQQVNPAQTQAQRSIAPTMLNKRIAARITATSNDPNVPDLSFVTNSTEPVSAGSQAVSGSATIVCDPACQVGGTASADPGDLAVVPNNADVSFEWLADGTVVAVGADAPVALTANLAGQQLVLRFTFRATGYEDAVYDTAAVTVEPGELDIPGATVLSGAAQVGRLVAVTAGQTMPPSRISYQWELDGSEIDGATSASYTPRPRDVDGELRVVVTYRSEGYATRREVVDAGAVLPGVLATGIPGITGSPAEGQTLTAVPPNLAVDDADVVYQWLADGEPIEGADAETFELGAEQVGRQISVKVMASAQGYEDWQEISTAIGPVSEYYTAITAPSISGEAKVDEELAIDTTGAFEPTPDSVSIEWLADGRPMVAATGQTFTPSAAQVGQLISVRLTAVTDGITDVVVNTAGVRVQPGVLTGSGRPTITGTPQVGNLLVAGAAAFVTDPAGQAYSYQWLANGEPIEDATDETLLLTREQYLAEISVRVTADRDGYESVSGTSLRTSEVAGLEFVVDKPELDQVPQEGLPVGVSLADAFDPRPTRYSYQWLLDGDPIAGATGATYTPKDSEVGKRLSVTVGASRVGYEPASTTSQSDTVIPKPVVTQVTPPAAPWSLKSSQASRTSAKVTWSNASDNPTGTRYTITAQPGGKSCTVRHAENTCTITGLTNGKTYEFYGLAEDAGLRSEISGPWARLTLKVTPTPGPDPVDPTKVTVKGKFVKYKGLWSLKKKGKKLVVKIKGTKYKAKAKAKKMKIAGKKYKIKKLPVRFAESAGSYYPVTLQGKKKAIVKVNGIKYKGKPKKSGTFKVKKKGQPKLQVRPYKLEVR